MTLRVIWNGFRSVKHRQSKTHAITAKSFTAGDLESFI